MIALLLGTLICLILFALPTIIVDPLFHYHGPIDGIQYGFGNERYQNDGIIRHYAYDALITGSSMTENFKTSEVDGLWAARSIKIPFEAAGLKETGGAISRAIGHNDKLEHIFWGVDLWTLDAGKDWLAYDISRYPTYLYDENPFNDVKYFLNKEVLVNSTWESAILYTIKGGSTTSFDSYANWMHNRIFGREAVLAMHTHRPEAAQQRAFDSDAQRIVRENLEQNVIPLAAQNPNIDFYFFFTPVSILWWDNARGDGMLDFYIEMMRYTAKLLLPYENIRLYSFFDEYDIVCDLDNYKDSAHYHEDINSQMLLWMHRDEHRLTEDNYEAYFEEIMDFYTSYDYEEFAA